MLSMPIGTTWRPFKDEVVELTPEKPSVYELGYKETDVVVYIGSGLLHSRLCSHRKRKTFMKVTHFRFRKVPSLEKARKLEYKLCEDFRKKNKGKLPRLQKRAPPKPRSTFGW